MISTNLATAPNLNLAMSTILGGLSSHTAKEPCHPPLPPTLVNSVRLEMDVPRNTTLPPYMKQATKSLSLCQLPLIVLLCTSAKAGPIVHIAMPVWSSLLVQTMLTWDGLSRDIVMEQLPPRPLQLFILIPSASGTMAPNQSSFTNGPLVVLPHTMRELAFASSTGSTSARVIPFRCGARWRHMNLKNQCTGQMLGWKPELV